MPVTVVNNKPPTVTLSLSTTGPIKAPANITIDASAGDADGHVTQVAFYQNGTLIATDTTSPYGIPWTGIGPGSYHMTAVATDDDGATTTSADVVLTVVANQPPSVSITAPMDGAVFTAPVNIAINANAGDNDGSVTQVAFYVNGALLGTDTTSPYGFAWNGVAAGSYTLTAIATDDNGATMSSAAVQVTVNVPVRMNQALATNGGVALASTIFNASYPAAAAINGDRKGLNWGAGGGWCDNTQSVWPDWLEVDFNGLKTIDEINVFSMQDSFNSPLEPTKTMTFASFGLRTFQVQYLGRVDVGDRARRRHHEQQSGLASGAVCADHDVEDPCARDLFAWQLQPRDGAGGVGRVGKRTGASAGTCGGPRRSPVNDRLFPDWGPTEGAPSLP